MSKPEPRFRIRAPALQSASQIRRGNLAILLEEFAGDPREVALPKRGRYSRFAERIGTTGDSFQHVRQGRRAIGHALARRLEVAFGKPTNWMDIAHGTSASTGVEPTEKMRQMLSELLDRAAAVDVVETHRALLAIVAHRAAPQ
jgi:hypothetical protein